MVESRLFISISAFFSFISMSHSNNGNNLIVSGIYNYHDLKMENCKTIESPNNCWCEKNWTPFVNNNLELVVYKWSPMEVCSIVKDDDSDVKRLETVFSYKIKNTLFSKFRGSSVFSRIGDNLIGLVHFSEGENLKRKYFHALVLVDGYAMGVYLSIQTKRPLQINLFTFLYRC